MKRNALSNWYRSLLLASVVLPSLAYAADLGITPPRLELLVTPGEVSIETVTVLTSVGTEVEVTATLGDWTLDAGGQLRYLTASSHPHSNAGWLNLDAADFTVRAGNARVVRLEVTAPPDPSLAGTHHGVVFFTVAPQQGAVDSMGLATTTRIGLIVYVTIAGTERAGSELVDMYQPDDRSLTTVIQNTGNTVMRLGGAVEIRDEAGDVVRRLEVPDVPVLRESERELTFTLPDDLASGFYVALALIHDSRGGILAGELPFDVP